MTLKSAFCTIAYRKNEAITLPEIFDELVETGYNGVELWWPHVENLSETEQKEMAALASQKGLAIPIISPYLGNYNLEMNNADEMLERIKAAAPVAAAMQVPLLRAFAGWTCECSSLTASDEYWEYNLKGFKEMCMVADSHGLDIVIETHSATLGDSVEGVMKFVDFCGPRIKVNLQLDDIRANSQLVNDLEVYTALKDLVVHAHIPPLIETDKAEQYKSVFAAMQADGFEGYLSIEHCCADGIPREAAVQGMATLKNLMEQ